MQKIKKLKHISGAELMRAAGLKEDERVYVTTQSGEIFIRKASEELEPFPIPSQALKTAGFEDGDRLCINASEGKILIEKVLDEDEFDDDDFDEDFPICPCCANKKK